MTSTARDVVDTAVAELKEIVGRARGSGSPQLMIQELERWKRRTTEDLRSFVSPSEASTFARIALRPNWVNMESPDGPLERHAAFLVALRQDLEARPGRTVAVPSGGPPKELPGKPVVFLSHAAADAALAEYVEQIIRRDVANIEVFRTTRLGQIPPGKAWFQHITNHLSGASKYVVLLTPASQSRPWVNFETGAAWMTARPLVPVLGGGLRPHEVVEPLKHLQLLSIEDPGQASQILAELGGQLTDPVVCCERAMQLGRLGKEKALDDGGWKQVELEGKRFAWEGPLEDLKESNGVPLPDGLIPALQARGMSPRTGIPGDLWNEFSQGYVQVWYIDQRMYKHAVVSGDKQVLLAKPA